MIEIVGKLRPFPASSSEGLDDVLGPRTAVPLPLDSSPWSSDIYEILPNRLGSGLENPPGF